MVLKSQQRNRLETGLFEKEDIRGNPHFFIRLIDCSLSLNTRLRPSLRLLNSTVLQLISDWHPSLFLKRGPLISDRGRPNHFRAINQLEWRLSVLFFYKNQSLRTSWCRVAPAPLGLLGHPPGSMMFTHILYDPLKSDIENETVLYTQHWLSVRLSETPLWIFHSFTATVCSYWIEGLRTEHVVYCTECKVALRHCDCDCDCDCGCDSDLYK